ncbi:MAG TPA: sigma-70 family RNA polymerase sigma factor [Planctomycetota bacterium]
MTSDPSRLSECLRRHAGLIHRVARAYGRDAAEREDVVQEIAVQLWRALARLDPGRRESTWVYRIALNVAISHARREGRHRAGSEEPLFTLAAPAAAEPGHEVELLQACIAELGPLEKALVLLHLDGNDHAAIAEVLGLSVSNVGTKLQRTRARLRAALERRARTETPRTQERRHATG